MKPVKALAPLVAVLAGLGALGAAPAPDEQLDSVRRRIGVLEARLGELDRENRSRQEERERLSTELELAEARVREVELVLGRSRSEAEAVTAEVGELETELERQRELLAGHVEMIALLGRPGTAQLLLDGARGGDLERALSTVAALASGQVRLVEEYGELRQQRSARLADLSRILERARLEAAELETLRAGLESTRTAVDAKIHELERSQRSASSELGDLRQREEALTRLLGTLGERGSFSAAEDIRRFRGALPWPVSGTVVQSFGRHYLPRYSTYTVCNGLRLRAASGAEVTAVFPGEVAYARFFKGYGNMVVVDHGHDVYSLVAGLASIHVRVKQPVAMGTRLGVASPPSEEGNTYFEIRVGKKPQDPRRWLQLEAPSRGPRG